MKFSEMSYTRPDLDELKNRMRGLTASLRAAEDYQQAREAFLEKDLLNRHVETLAVLVSVRHSIDTRDEFYSAEQDFWNATMPELEEYVQEWTLALLESPFRTSFEEEFGNLMFVNAEIALKTFLPTEEFITAMKEENDVSNAYEKLLASAAIRLKAASILSLSSHRINLTRMTGAGLLPGRRKGNGTRTIRISSMNFTTGLYI